MIGVFVSIYEFRLKDGSLRYSCRMHRHKTTHAADSAGSSDSTLTNVPGLTLGPVLGRGAYGVVRLGTFIATGKVCAIKIITKSTSQAEDFVRVRREVAIMQQLDHPNIAKLCSVVETGTLLCMAIEFCGGGEVKIERVLKFVVSASNDLLFPRFFSLALRIYQGSQTHART